MDEKKRQEFLKQIASLVEDSITKAREIENEANLFVFDNGKLRRVLLEQEALLDKLSQVVAHNAEGEE